MKALIFLAACTAATPIPPRAPSPGVAPYPFPSTWQEPALLCVNGYRMGWTFEHGWRCL